MVQLFAKGTNYQRASHFLAIVLLLMCPWAQPSAYCQQAAPRVITTTSIIGSITSQIAGDNIVVESLMGPGVDPHLYKPSPGDLRKLSEASLVLYNGLHLEGKMSELLEKLASRKPVVAVAAFLPKDKLRMIGEAAATVDPHIWLDVALWTTAAQHIRDALIRVDPARSERYTSRFNTLQTELTSLHTWCKTEIEKIPIARRVLVTAHDAFGYFGRAYTIRVLGIQGVTTDSEASLREINSIVNMLVEQRIPAIFIESTISPKTVHALIEGAKAQGHTVRIGGELYSDSTGALGTDASSYQGMIRHNVATITQALGGDES